MCRVQVSTTRTCSVLCHHPACRPGPMANRCPSRYQSPDSVVVCRRQEHVRRRSSVLKIVVRLLRCGSLLFFRNDLTIHATLKLRVLPASHDVYRSITHTIHHRRLEGNNASDLTSPASKVPASAFSQDLRPDQADALQVNEVLPSSHHPRPDSGRSLKPPNPIVQCPPAHWPAASPSPARRPRSS